MSQFQKSKHCRNCGCNTLHVKPDVSCTSFGLSFGMAALTVLTCGLFLPVAIIMIVLDGAKRGSVGYNCQRCGTRN